jgi:hypothetical protein
VELKESFSMDDTTMFLPVSREVIAHNARKREQDKRVGGFMDTTGGRL